MFAIAFDLDVHDTALNHPKSLIHAYKDIRGAMQRNGFEWKQGSVYTSTEAGLVQLFTAMNELKALTWFPRSVRNIRAFRMENYSDFAEMMKR